MTLLETAYLLGSYSREYLQDRRKDTEQQKQRWQIDWLILERNGAKSSDYDRCYSEWRKGISREPFQVSSKDRQMTKTGEMFPARRITNELTQVLQDYLEKECLGVQGTPDRVRDLTTNDTVGEIIITTNEGTFRVSIQVTRVQQKQGTKGT
jgi:hypothetical protein